MSDATGATAAESTETSTPILRVRGLRKRYRLGSSLPGRPARHLDAVKGVDLDVPRGRALGVVGESGCGKSTLAKMIVGLVEPTAGEIELDGVSVATGRGRDRGQYRRMQMVFQDPLGSLNPRKTVRQLIEAPLVGLTSSSGRQRRQRVDELMELVGLRAEFVDRHPHEFSGGQCQRISIARALATNADLIVLDEPVSALDVSIQAQILDLLDDLRSRLGLTYFFISHDLSVVAHLCDEVAVMHFGEIVERGPVGDVLGSPQHDYTKVLLDALPGERLRQLRAGAGGTTER